MIRKITSALSFMLALLSVSSVGAEEIELPMIPIEDILAGESSAQAEAQTPKTTASTAKITKSTTATLNISTHIKTGDNGDIEVILDPVLLTTAPITSANAAENSETQISQEENETPLMEAETNAELKTEAENSASKETTKQTTKKTESEKSKSESETETEAKSDSESEEETATTSEETLKTEKTDSSAETTVSESEESESDSKTLPIVLASGGAVAIIAGAVFVLRRKAKNEQ